MMEMVRIPLLLALTGVLGLVLLPCIRAESSPAPAPASDGVAIDQGIAYLLMLAALVVTYLLH